MRIEWLPNSMTKRGLERDSGVLGEGVRKGKRGKSTFGVLDVHGNARDLLRKLKCKESSFVSNSKLIRKLELEEKLNKPGWLGLIQRD